jgi:hypothetical protein
MATAEIYDPKTDHWQSTGAMRYARSGPAVTSLTDGRVLVVGSSNDNVHIDDRAYRTVEIYDPVAGAFVAADSLPRIDIAGFTARGIDLPDWAPTPGNVGSLAALPDGGALLIGNTNWWKPSSWVVRSFKLSGDASAWSEVGDAFAWSGLSGTGTGGICRSGAAVARLPDGSVLIAGGTVAGIWVHEDIPDPPRSVQRYDPESDAWVALADLPEGREWPVAAQLADGSILLAGGMSRVGSGSSARYAWAAESYRYVAPD